MSRGEQGTTSLKRKGTTGEKDLPPQEPKEAPLQSHGLNKEKKILHKRGGGRGGG